MNKEEEEHLLRMGSIGKWFFIIVATFTAFVGYPVAMVIGLKAGFLWQFFLAALTSLLLIGEMVASHFFFKWLLAKAKRLERATQ